MPTKPDLRQAISSFGIQRPLEPAREGPPPSNSRNLSPHYRPSRDGKATVSGYYPREVRKQLRGMAAEHETTIEDLLAEALNDLFAKYKKPELAPRKGRN